MLGSRFIATACPAADEAAARAAIESIRAEFDDATHHCWAWRLPQPGPETGEHHCEDRDTGARERVHDAGEPAGTAGPPILQAIRGAGLAGLVVVVSRWFGGTKLGKGGLARAYREAARAALAGAPVAARPREVERIVTGPIDQDGPLRHLLARWSARVIAADYGAGTVTLSARLPADAEPELRAALESLTRGAVRMTASRGPDRQRG